MKKVIIASLFFFLVFSFNISAQNVASVENNGKTLNLGLGVGGYSGYYGYVGHSVPVFHINYEFDVANNFTLAPFLSFYTYKNSYYWGSRDYNYQYYYYHETVIPIGVKGTFYFDQLLNASPKWDFYLAGSLGFAITFSSWDNNYHGDRNYYHNASPLFLDLHIGTEYHVNNRLGLFFDLSTSVSTIGIAIH
jgi:hypothetical protein